MEEPVDCLTYNTNNSGETLERETINFVKEICMLVIEETYTKFGREVSQEELSILYDNLSATNPKLLYDTIIIIQRNRLTQVTDVTKMEDIMLKLDNVIDRLTERKESQ